jgi:hypothetical protein
MVQVSLDRRLQGRIDASLIRQSRDDRQFQATHEPCLRQSCDLHFGPARKM